MVNQSMMILGNAMTAQSLMGRCSNGEQSSRFLELMDYLNSTFSTPPTSNVVMRAACYHQGEPNDDSMPTFFPFHFDKAFASAVWFVPLSNHLFFTLVAIPSSWNVQQDSQSNALFHKWISIISSDNKRTVEVFMEAMEKSATATMKESRLLVYACKMGSFLSFPASTCLHATITPGLTDSNESCFICRDLLIVHPLELV
jgi:hypothetical protein